MTEHFFIIGAQRSGTTYLYHLLDEHPEICMARPLRPEPKFFLKNELYARGLEYYETCYFPDCGQTQLRGEKSASYMESALAAERLATHYPQAKIIILLRDPIERAISNYWFSHNHGLETWPIEKAFWEESSRETPYDPSVSVNPFHYLRRGRYMDFIDVYDRLFPPEQVCGLIYEQLLGNLSQVQALYRFLGAAATFAPQRLHQASNASQQEDYALSPDLRRFLADYFAEANGRLTARFGFDLRSWWPSCL